MMKITNCTVCGGENIFRSVRAKDAFICGDCKAAFAAVPEQITVTEDGTPETDLRLGLLFMADGKTAAAREYLGAAAEAGIELAGLVLSLLKEEEQPAAAAEETVSPEPEEVSTEKEEVSPEKDSSAEAACGENSRSFSLAHKTFFITRENTFRRGIKLMQSDPEKACAELRKAADRGHIKANFNLGVCLEKMGLYAEAMLRYKAAAGREWAANEKLAVLYIKFGKETEAEKLLIASADHLRTASFLMLGDLYSRQGKTELAREYYELCFGVRGYEISAKKRLAQMDRAG